MMINPKIFLIFCVLCSVGCDPIPSKDTVNASLGLFSSKDTMSINAIDKVLIDIQGKMVQFGNGETYSIDDLRSVLHRGLISGGDPRISKFGSRQEKFGVIRVIVSSSQLNLPLYKSSSVEDLYAVKFPQVGDSGYSITYFASDEIFRKYLSDAK